MTTDEINALSVRAGAAYREWREAKRRVAGKSTPGTRKLWKEWNTLETQRLRAEREGPKEEPKAPDPLPSQPSGPPPTSGEDAIAIFLRQSQPQSIPQDEGKVQKKGPILIVKEPTPKWEGPTTTKDKQPERKNVTVINLEEFKGKVLLRVKVSMWGNTRKGKLTDEAVAKIVGNMDGLDDREREQRLAVAKARLKLNKSLVDCPEYQDIVTWRGQFTKYMLRVYMNQSYLDEGLYVVRMEVLPETIAQIERGRRNLQSLVNRFLGVYETQQQIARDNMVNQYSEDDYPSPERLAQRFRIDYRVIEMTVPEGLPPEIRQEEEKKLRESFEEARKAVIAALWAEYQGYLDHIVDRLKPGQDGKRKKFNDTLFGNIALFVNAFNNRNAFNDAKLAALVRKSEEILSTIGESRPSDMADSMRGDAGLRDRTRKAFEAVKDEVARSIVDIPKRSFTVEE